jgi:carboxylesterase type B
MPQIFYRNAHLGWLSTGDDVLPGNLGYWDVTAALKFVHENIKYFGGNPNEIFVWGISSGGVMASGLVLSPHSRGMARRC